MQRLTWRGAQNVGLEVGVGLTLGGMCAWTLKNHLDKDIAPWHAKAQAQAAAPAKVRSQSPPSAQPLNVTSLWASGPGLAPASRRQARWWPLGQAPLPQQTTSLFVP